MQANGRALASLPLGSHVLQNRTRPSPGHEGRRATSTEVTAPAPGFQVLTRLTLGAGGSKRAVSLSETGGKTQK